MQQHIYYTKYALRFADMQIPELVNIFNSQVQSRGWSSMRAYHDQALLDEFHRRGIDTTSIYDGRTISSSQVRHDQQSTYSQRLNIPPIQNSALGSLLFANGGVYNILVRDRYQSLFFSSAC